MHVHCNTTDIKPTKQKRVCMQQSPENKMEMFHPK